MYDAVILGYGPAGVSAALYLLRANKRVALIGRDFGALEKAELIENYYGLPKPVSGHALGETGLNQAKQLGADIFTAEIVDLSYNNGDFIAKTADGRSFSAPCAIIATGNARKSVPIEGLAEFEGRGVSYCAVCDAFFYRGKTAGVLGAGEYALAELNHLLPVAGNVLLLTNGEKLSVTAPQGVEVYAEPVEKIYGEGTVSGVKFKSGDNLSLSGVFVALGFAGAGDLARKLGAGVQDGKIITDEQMATAVPGLFAAGDCVGRVLQVSTAVGNGAAAALSAIKFLNGRKP